MDLNDEVLEDNVFHIIYHNLSASEIMFVFKEIVMHLTKSLLLQIEDVLSSENTNEKKKAKIHSKMESLFQLFVTAYQEPFKKFEIALRNKLKIPEDQIIKTPDNLEKYINKSYTEDEMKQVKERYINLRKEYLKKQLYVSKLKESLKSLEKLESLRAVAKQLQEVSVKLEENDKLLRKSEKIKNLTKPYKDLIDLSHIQQPEKSNLHLLIMQDDMKLGKE